MKRRPPGTETLNKKKRIWDRPGEYGQIAEGEREGVITDTLNRRNEQSK